LATHLAKTVDEMVREPVAEIFRLGIATDVLKRQDRHSFDCLALRRRLTDRPTVPTPCQQVHRWSDHRDQEQSRRDANETRRDAERHNRTVKGGIADHRAQTEA
jgi:hypothetical protein